MMVSSIHSKVLQVAQMMWGKQQAATYLVDGRHTSLCATGMGSQERKWIERNNKDVRVMRTMDFARCASLPIVEN